jgi:KaiC/GvpD/RAD55 family RecA-like ATPase
VTRRVTVDDFNSVPEPMPAESAGARLRSLAEVRPRRVRWLVPGKVPLRTLTLVAGVGGLGKSTWLLAVAAQGSRGELGDPWDTIVVSFEDPAAEVIRPRVEAAGGDLGRIHEVVLDGDGIDAVSLPRDIDVVQTLVRQVRARLLVLDPIVAAIETSFDTHKDQHVRAVLARLASLAEEEDLAVAMVGHLNKAPSTDAYLRVANSVAFWNASRSVVLVTEDPGEPDTLRLLAQRKANWSRLHSVERHRIETIILPETVDPETGEPIETSRIVFVEVADDVDSADVLGPSRETKTGRAEDLLALLLADGEWHDSATLRPVAEAAGVSARTLQRAAHDLDVEHDRRGFPASTYWRLPTVAPTLTPKLGATEDPAQPRRSETIPDPVAPTQRETARLTIDEWAQALPEHESAILRDLHDLLDARPVPDETDAANRAAPAGRVTSYARDGRTDAREADEVERLRAVFVGTIDEPDADEAETLRYLDSVVGDPEREEAAS